jgi:hypothetical protein
MSVDGSINVRSDVFSDFSVFRGRIGTREMGSISLLLPRVLLDN